MSRLSNESINSCRKALESICNEHGSDVACLLLKVGEDFHIIGHGKNSPSLIFGAASYVAKDIYQQLTGALEEENKSADSSAVISHE
jgi:hypothetical protein